MLLKLLDRPIAYHRVLAEIAGSVGGGVFLSQALYWAKRATLPDGWFYKTAEEWYEETYLTRREQETIRKRLVSINILQEEKRGVPAKLHYKINLSALESYAMTRSDTRVDNEVNEAVQTSFNKSAKLDSPETPNLVQQIRQTNTETTAETTTETTNIHTSAQAEFDEFWAAYPKRTPHANPKHPASLKYINARQKLKVPREVLLTAAKAYAASVAGKDPEMIAQAVTWLNQRRWEDYDGSAPEPQPKATISDEAYRAVIEHYPGKASDADEAKRLMAAEVNKGAKPEDIADAAHKFKLLVKQARNDGHDMAVPIFETWLKFKWRDMDAYEFYRGGMTMKLFVRPKRGK